MKERRKAQASGSQRRIPGATMVGNVGARHDFVPLVMDISTIAYRQDQDRYRQGKKSVTRQSARRRPIRDLEPPESSAFSSSRILRYPCLDAFRAALIS